MNLIGRVRGKLFAVRHKAYVRGLSRVAPFYLVNEFPKSGGTWLAQMLAQAIDLPFRRNEPIRLEAAITHGHFISPLGLANTLVLWRDPRDVVVSYYFHSYFVNEHNNAGLVALMKMRHPFQDYTDIRSNLPRFIEILSREPVSPSFSWPDFAKIWAGRPGTVQTSYEALRADTAQELKRVTEALTGRHVALSDAQVVVEANSFDRARVRAKLEDRNGVQMSFVREGSVGGWKKHFTPDAEAMLEKFGYSAPMHKLGYLSGPCTVE